MSVILMLPARIAAGSLLKSPFILGSIATLVGGGAAAGVAKLEYDYQSISQSFIKSGAFLSKIFKTDSSSSLDQNNESAFLERGLNSAFSFFADLPNQISSIYSSVSPYISNTFNGLKSQNYSEIVSLLKTSQVEWTDISEILSDLGAKKDEVKKIVEKLIEQSSLLKNIYETVSKNKDEYLKTVRGVAEKAGGYKQLLKYALQESDLLTQQLEKLKDKGNTISSKMNNLVKKINEKKEDIEEIVKDIEGSNFTKEGGAGTQIKKDLGVYLESLTEQSDKLENGVSTLKTQKDKLKKLIGESGNSISNGLEKKDQLSKSLGLDSSGGVKLSDVFDNLKEIKDDSFSKLENIQQKMISSPQASKLLIKSAGKGGTGFVKVINNWSKYESLLGSSSK